MSYRLTHSKGAGVVELLPEGWITTEQAQQLTGYNAEHLNRLARQGKIEARKIGAAWVYNRESLMRHKETSRPGRKARKTTE